MKEKVVITGYKDMCFESGEGDNKQTVDFIKLTLLTSNSGQDAVGYLPTQVTYMGEEKTKISKSITDVPGLYDAEYAMIPGKNNKASLEIIGFTFLKPVDIHSFLK